MYSPVLSAPDWWPPRLLSLNCQFWYTSWFFFGLNAITVPRMRHLCKVPFYLSAIQASAPECSGSTLACPHKPCPSANRNLPALSPRASLSSNSVSFTHLPDLSGLWCYSQKNEFLWGKVILFTFLTFESHQFMRERKTQEVNCFVFFRHMKSCLTESSLDFVLFPKSRARS